MNIRSGQKGAADLSVITVLTGALEVPLPSASGLKLAIGPTRAGA